MRRTIPKLGVLAFATTAGCGPDPIAGDWDGTFLATTGYDPISLPHFEEGVTTAEGVFDYYLNLSATFNGNGTGSLAFHERFTDGDEVVYEKLERYPAIQGDRLSRGNWVYQVPSYDDLILDCTAERKTLTCVGDDAVGAEYQMDFERQEE